MMMMMKSMMMKDDDDDDDDDDKHNPWRTGSLGSARDNSLTRKISSCVQVLQPSLILVHSDHSSGYVLWFGTASGLAARTSPSSRQDRLDHAAGMQESGLVTSRE
jgi:hypothetical protein